MLNFLVKKECLIYRGAYPYLPGVIEDVTLKKS